MMSNTDSDLASLGSSSDQSSRLAALISSCDVSASAEDAATRLEAVLARFLQDDVSQQAMKATALLFAKKLKELVPLDERYVEVALHAISALKAHPSSFDEPDHALRETLFNYYISIEQFKEAAQILAGVNVDSNTKIFSDMEKADIYVKCAESYLEEDEPVDAEVFVNKASLYMNNISDVSIQLRYRAVCARVLDANRKFVDAAIKYYELSNTSSINVVEEDLYELLGKAVTCAVLGKTGPQRSRVLGLLYKDERSRRLEQYPKFSSHVQVLTSMYLEHLLRQEDLSGFEASLAPHQRARTGDGLTVLQKAVIEHNMLAAGSVYDNIRFDELGNLLGLDAQAAERAAARMICEDRLKASIDQTEGLLLFRDGSRDSVLRWDEKVASVLSYVDV